MAALPPPKPIHLLAPPYVVEISKLSEGRHALELHVTGELFAGVPEAEIQAANVRIDAVVDKTARHLDLHLHLQGTLTLACDRCLRPFVLPIDATQRRIFSHDPATADAQDDTISYLPRAAHALDLTADVYDFVALCVPLRRVPADCPSDACSPEMLAYLSNETNDDTKDETESAFARQLKEKLGGD